MQRFTCECGARAFFENNLCLTCGRELAYLPAKRVMSAIEQAEDGNFRASYDGSLHRKCGNQVEHAVCNWLVQADDMHALCVACRLNVGIPNVDDDKTKRLWADAESAKRRLFYSLQRLELPLATREEAPDGLAFDIRSGTPSQPVVTGHDNGLITLNLTESDPVAREKTRLAMGERYRTVLGHFRHEIGHYYWRVLVHDSQWVEPFRALFGDERADYGEALSRHYDSPPSDWSTDFISEYATAHPWEDWAETWAHYLHIRDTLETALDFGLVPTSQPCPGEGDFGQLLEDWNGLTVALNALNRSMGMPDPYPFQIAGAVSDKLSFVDEVVAAARGVQIER